MSSFLSDLSHTVLSMASDSFTILECLLTTAAPPCNCPLCLSPTDFCVRKRNNVFYMRVSVNGRQLNVFPEVAFDCSVSKTLPMVSSNGF